MDPPVGTGEDAIWVGINFLEGSASAGQFLSFGMEGRDAFAEPATSGMKHRMCKGEKRWPERIDVDEPNYCELWRRVRAAAASSFSSG